ncbi:MAG: AI-2E family transporter [Candidatus Riflebacteria bacterium]|nr:AI-2E family transporter [Candidatus Riflebacteria bacterium]
MTELDPRSAPLIDLSREKIFIWLLFGGLVYALRDFFSIVFMTFMMTVLAQRLVAVLTRTGAGRPEDRWIRKPVVIVVYVTALAVSYLAGQSLLPRAIDQGRWLLEQINSLDLEKIRDDALAATLGRIEFARYEKGDRYARDLKAFADERYSLASYAEAIRVAREIRQTFQDDQAVKEGQKALAAARQTGELDDQYRRWLRSTRAEQELTTSSEIARNQLEAFDQSFNFLYGEEEFKKQKDLPTFQKTRQDRVLERVTKELFDRGLDRGKFEAELAAKRGRERYQALPEKEREERFRAFFQVEVPKRFSRFPYSYEKTLVLEGVKDEREFRQKLRGDAPDDQEIKELFARWMRLKLGNEYPGASLQGDTSHVVRTALPHVTGWLTTLINDALAFGLNALLSLMFSFMIVWEIPRLSRGLAALEGTPAGRIYQEIAPGMARLGTTIAAGFSAQLVIATINAGLAFFAMTFLGLPTPVFLSLLLLIACLIPYVGVLVGALPILLVALQAGGHKLCFHALIALFLIHELEACILSPKILARPGRAGSAGGRGRPGRAAPSPGRTGRSPA